MPFAAGHVGVRAWAPNLWGNDEVPLRDALCPHVVVTGQLAAAWGLRPALGLVVLQFLAVAALQWAATAPRSPRGA